MFSDRSHKIRNIKGYFLPCESKSAAFFLILGLQSSPKVFRHSFFSSVCILLQVTDNTVPYPPGLKMLESTTCSKCLCEVFDQGGKEIERNKIINK